MNQEIREALFAFKMSVCGKYEDDPRSKPVDWNRALVWMRQNPPPEYRSARP